MQNSLAVLQNGVGGEGRVTVNDEGFLLRRTDMFSNQMW